MAVRPVKAVQPPLKLSLIFILTMTSMASLCAFSIDIMLPALPAIGESFNREGNALQKVITFFILGMCFGELLWGPLSDRFGRRPIVLISSGVFLLGCLLCSIAWSFEWLVIGRVFQGFGGAGPKIVIRAVLRDLYAGPALAKVFSLIYTLFIFIPMIAPLIGQGITLVGDWHSIFYVLFGFSAVATCLFAIKQPETLAPTKRLPLSFLLVARNTVRIFSHQKVALLTLISGLVFGIKLTYLSTAQSMFSDFYGITERFPFYFALLASAIGIAFFANSQLVMRFGRYRLSWIAFLTLCGVSMLLCGLSFLYSGVPPFMWFLTCFYLMFFCFGLVWGNINSMAMEFLGNLAGLGATMIAAGSSLVSFALASIVGSFYDGQLTAMAVGFVVLAFAALGCFWRVEVSSHRYYL